MNDDMLKAAAGEIESGLYHEIVIAIAELIEVAVGERDAVIDMQRVIVTSQDDRTTIRYWKLHWYPDLTNEVANLEGTLDGRGAGWVHHEAGTVSPTLMSAVLGIARVYAHDFDSTRPEGQQMRLRTEFLEVKP